MGSGGWFIYTNIDLNMTKISVGNKLLYGGIVAPLTYLLVDMVGKLTIPNFSLVENAVSELTQAGSENTVLFSAAFFLSAIMTIFFGAGIIICYREFKLLKFGGILLIILGSISSLTGTIFPMDPIGSEHTLYGNLHLILTGVSVPISIALIVSMGAGLYREKHWKYFWVYSLVTLLTMLVFGGLSPWIISNKVEFMGLFERVVVYAYLLWVFILAMALIQDLRNKVVD